MNFSILQDNPTKGDFFSVVAKKLRTTFCPSPTKE